MSAVHGKNGYIKVGDNNLSSYLNSKSLDTSTDIAEVSTFGNDSKKYIQGLEDGTIPLEGPWDSTVDGYMAALKGAGETSFEYGPAGNAGGNVKYSGNVVLSAYNISQDLTGAISFSATLQLSGDVTRGTFSA